MADEAELPTTPAVPEQQQQPAAQPQSPLNAQTAPETQNSVPAGGGVQIYDISGSKPVLGSINPSEVTDAVASGKYSLPQGEHQVMSPDGQLGTLDASEAPEAFKNGYRFATPEEVDKVQFSTPGQQAIAGVEGLAKGVAGPLATGAERFFGVPAENIEKRAKYNPITHYSAEAAGLIAPALATAGTSALAKLGLEGAAEILPTLSAASEFTQAGVLEKAGAAAANAVGLGGETAGLANVAKELVKGATEWSLLQAGDETSKMLVNDPQQSIGSAAANVGLAGLIGGAAGGAIGAVSPLWKATFGNKIGQVLEDFKGRINEHLTNPDPAQAMTEELQNHYNAVTGMADEVYGANGLKSKDIVNSMPEMHEGITNQIQELSNKLKKSVDEMITKPNSYPGRLVSKLQGDMEAFQSAVSNAQSPAEIFNATQDLKQTLQGYSKYEKFVKPVDEAYDFVQKAKSLAHDFRTNLEDPVVWGKAGERQQAINKAFKEYLPALKDFEKKFTVEVGGERQIDPGKVNTYLNQVGKPNAEIKQQMLENFLKQSEKYQETIHQTHANLGIDSPVVNTPLNVTRGTLKAKSVGSKIADILIKKGLSDAAGTTIGATAGHMTGIPGADIIGALIGEHQIAPFMQSVLPAMIKPMLGAAGNAEGFKAALDYGMAVAKGDMLANKAAKNIFRSGAQVLSESQMPTAKSRMKLDKLLEAGRETPMDGIEKAASNPLTHYAPQHAAAQAEISANAMKYLDSLRPNNAPKAMLDQKVPPNPMAQAKYDRALNIAQQPLIVLDSIKNGTLVPQDLVHLHNLYPAFYDGLRSKVLNQLTDVAQKGQSVPYATRLSLSMFLGQALDSTMTPAAIIGAQPISAPQQQNMAPQAKKGSKALQNAAKPYKTSTQAGEEDRNDR